MTPGVASSSNEASVGRDNSSVRRAPHTTSVGGVAWGLITSATVACLAAFQFGFATGVLNVPQHAITDEVGLPPNGWGWSMVVSSWCFAGLLGTQTAAPIADKHGRRALLALSAVLCSVSGLLLFASGSVALAGVKDAAGVNELAVGLLIAGRLVSGVGCGLATVAVPLYLGEIASTSVRGLFGSLNQLAVVLSIFAAQGLGAAAQLSHVHYSWVLGAPALFGAAQLLLMFLVPESPRWCLSMGGGIDSARVALVRLRRRDDAAALEDELEQMQSDLRKMRKSAAATGSRRQGVVELWRKRDLRLPLLTAGIMMVGQQCSGINAVFYYSTSFFQSAGLSNPVVGTLLASGVNAIAMVATVPMMERAGRRRLLLLGILGMLISALALSAVLIAEESPHVQLKRSMLDTAAIGFVLLFVATFELGPGPIPWQIGAEIFPEGPRATAMGFAATLNWLCNAAVGLGFPPMQRALGPYVFFPFAAVLAGWLVFTFRFVPETRGRTVAQVQAEFLKMAGSDVRSSAISEASGMLHGMATASSTDNAGVESGSGTPPED